MTRQTILTYLSEDDRAKGTLAAAATLARRHESHLIGVYAVPPLTVYPMMGMELPSAVYDGHAAMFHERSKKIEKLFDEATRGDAFVAEWRTVDAAVGRIADALMDHARCSDFVVAPHYSTDESDSPFYGVAEDIAMDSGRPVIMIPKHAQTDHIGDHVMVAWDGSRESARAVFDSIDLLRDAKEVRLLTVSEETSIGSNARLPAAEMAATLARRGIACEVDHIAPSKLSIGDAILARIGDMGSDLLVMGIYGHSKLREVVFGGATRNLLKHMTVPVLMSR